jgi:hypothetical protein
MEETTQPDYGLVGGAKLAAQQSPLTSLLETQEKSAHLLQVLAEKLSPVSNPHPSDSNKSIGDRGYHIETALYKQREINEAIAYLIDVVVV